MKTKVDEEAQGRSDAEVEKKKIEDQVKQLNEKLAQAANELQTEKQNYAALKNKVAVLFDKQ